MAEAAAVAPPATMLEYLERVIGVTNQQMREKLVGHGIDSMESLVSMKKSDVEKACSAIRKSPTGPVASRDVTMVIQTRLEKLLLHVKYKYLTQT